MNFFILDGADIMLRHVILYGVASFDKLHQTLNDVWMPDVKKTSFRRACWSRAYPLNCQRRQRCPRPCRRPDARVQKGRSYVRSVQKGALAFAKTTTSELARFGAKLAIGTQTVLEGAEAFLSHNQRLRVSHQLIHGKTSTLLARPVLSTNLEPSHIMQINQSVLWQVSGVRHVILSETC